MTDIEEYEIKPGFGKTIPEVRRFLETPPKRYLDINSSKRNRTKFPNPCDFETPFLTYSGTERAPVSYNVRLALMSLPNLALICGYGGTPASYPYLYVDFQPVGTTESSLNKIWSSNRRACGGALFKVPFDDIRTSFIVNTPFSCLENCRMIQTVTMSPSNSFHVTIRTPTGEILRYATADTTPPTDPNRLLQTSFTFEIQRMV